MAIMLRCDRCLSDTVAVMCSISGLVLLDLPAFQRHHAVDRGMAMPIDASTAEA